MAKQLAMAILNNPLFRAALKQAWVDSRPGATGGHEEGGFILQTPEGDLNILRWPKGAQNTIELPVHFDGKIDESDILATFHTHPNTSSDYLQEPSETDRRAVQDDPNLKGETYVGEFVISQSRIYLVTPDGRVHDVENTQAIFALG